VVVFRVDAQGSLVAFAGHDCRQITIDGRTTVFAETALPLVTFSPIAPFRRVPGGAIAEVTIHGAGTVRIPAGQLPGKVKLFAEGATPGSKGSEVACQRDDRILVIRITPAESGRRLWITAAE
jgi:hypothetical protein